MENAGLKFCLFFSFLMILLTASAKENVVKFFRADDSRIQYVGRVDFSNPQAPRFWAPGVYISARFKGSNCQILINDEVMYGNNHNYIEIIIDGKNPYRIQLKEKENIISVPAGLSDGYHTIIICKDTESNNGYLDFNGFKCEDLVTPATLPKRKIEYFGDSITSGTAMDLSVVPCGQGQWYDQHNAYMSYGARTSRNLNAQWQISALAGVGLVHSCCDMKVKMPQIYDKDDLYKDSISWNFNRYQPDVVTICLGQNDGLQDSVLFCGAYVNLLKAMRQNYPKADIVCLSSPMADQSLTPVLHKYLSAITAYMNASGDKRVSKFFFSRQYHNGCGGHPDMAEHELIANELTAYIKQLKGW